MTALTKASATRRAWFSPRGARRGLRLSALAVMVWLAWWAGYLEATGHEAPAPLTFMAVPR